MKYLSYEGLQYLYSKILTRLGLKVDASGGDISSTKISAFDTVSTEFPVPAAGENTKTVFGKIKKFITDFNSLKSSLLLLSMLTSQYENNTSKIPTAALVYALKQSLDATNSNLSNKANTSDLENYLLKSNIVFEGAVIKARFGVASGVMTIDLYGGTTTFYRLSLDNNSKKISFSVFDGTSLNLLFEK